MRCRRPFALPAPIVFAVFVVECSHVMGDARKIQMAVVAALCLGPWLVAWLVLGCERGAALSAGAALATALVRWAWRRRQAALEARTRTACVRRVCSEKHVLVWLCAFT